MPGSTQTADPLSYARGVHKLGGFQIALVNLNREDRFKLENILLYGAALHSTIRKHGMARALTAVDKCGRQHNEPCFARDMRNLARGVWCVQPGHSQTIHSSNPASNLRVTLRVS